MIAQVRFRAGFDFLRLRADVDEVDEMLANWWQEFQQADEARREDLIAQVREEQRAKQKGTAGATKRGGKKPAGKPPAEGSDTGALQAVAEQALDDGETLDAPAKKRRRRRRKPGGAGQGGNSDAGE